MTVSSKSLEQINLSRIENYTSYSRYFWKFFRHCQSLEKIHLKIIPEYCSLLELIKSPDKLKKYHISGEIRINDKFTELVNGLRKFNTEMEELSLRIQGISNKQLKILGELLEECSELKIFCLNGCDALEESLKYVLKGLKSSAQSLNILSLIGFYRHNQVPNSFFWYIKSLLFIKKLFLDFMINLSIIQRRYLQNCNIQVYLN